MLSFPTSDESKGMMLVFPWLASQASCQFLVLRPTCRAFALSVKMISLLLSNSLSALL